MINLNILSYSTDCYILRNVWYKLTDKNVLTMCFNIIFQSWNFNNLCSLFIKKNKQHFWFLLTVSKVTRLKNAISPILCLKKNYNSLFRRWLGCSILSFVVKPQINYVLNLTGKHIRHKNMNNWKYNDSWPAKKQIQV